MKPLLEMQNITKIFPGVVALKDVNFNLEPGEVHVLLGENGAGKSTLMKVLAGAYKPEKGEIFLKGEKVTIQNPGHAQELGIGIVYQEFNLVPYLTVAENVFIDHFPCKRLGLIDHAKMHKEAHDLLCSMSMNVDTHALITEISTAQQQMVEVAKAMKHKSQILILDEPTSSLTEREIEQLFTTIRELKAKGIGIIYISHRMQELWEIGDRVTVLRDGEYVGTRNLKETTPNELVTMMVGREVSFLFKRDYCPPGEEILRVEHLSSNIHKLKDINLSVRKGEIVGLAGLVGSGRTELARTIFGLEPYSEGKLYLFGKELGSYSSSDAVKQGVALLPEDRKNQGLALILSVGENIVMASLERLFPRKFIHKRKEQEVVSKFIQNLRIVTPNANRQVQFLSGGNQQKVVLSKWLCTEADLFIFDEPTRGIDVNAKAEIHEFMNELVKNGAAILMISSELPEVIGMSDRIYVMRERKIVAELHHDEATQEKVIMYATAADQAIKQESCKE
ncbi:MAG TPA: sugar ABC transporter ATP-binding protein [Spirochaetales bacterium]|nr:sugar ABC transporter ATP-binding protein [Spirochaetales bacterium]